VEAKEMAERKTRGIAGDKTICLPIPEDIDYAQLVDDREAYRAHLEQQIKAHPELFPAAISSGYRFHGWSESQRQGIKLRRIYLPSTAEAYQLRPDFVTAYMSETADIAAKALYLKQHGISYEGIAYVMGRSEMHWYRLVQSLGRASIVGSTVKTAAALPPI
jgi:hypothetical protein